MGKENEVQDLENGQDILIEEEPLWDETESLMAQASRHFEQLFHGLPMACYCFDTQGSIVEWNRSCEVLFHRPVEQALLLPVWDVLGRPQDRELLQAFVRSVLSGHAYEEVEWEDTTAEGNTRHLMSNAFPLRNRAGVITGGITVNVDGTERMRMAQALWDDEERWQLALRGNNDGIWDWNVRTGGVFVSSRWKEIVGGAEAAATIDSGVTDTFLEAWFQRVHPEDRPAAISAFQEHLQKRATFYISEHRILCPDGAYRWVADRGQALWDRNGTVVRVAGSLTDIQERKHFEQEIRDVNSQLEEANRKLAALAAQDGLTGLLNHRAFQERLVSEIERARRYETPLALVLVDVDFFKQYNDTQGHPAGDDVLRAVARLLEQGVRDSDIVARYGGEEYALLLPCARSDDAHKVAERCRAAIETADWPNRAVTASFGIAILSLDMMTASDLVIAADQALYCSKRDGRNCVTLAETAAGL